ncbi:MAG: hypothetical protein MK102_17845 [Fuerstiella sp.]|nr:hypothetical protein [Fuerstiella sp.]
MPSAGAKGDQRALIVEVIEFSRNEVTEDEKWTRNNRQINHVQPLIKYFEFRFEKEKGTDEEIFTFSNDTEPAMSVAQTEH